MLYLLVFLCDFALTRVLVSMKSSFFSCLKHSVCVCVCGGGGGGVVYLFM